MSDQADTIERAVLSRYSRWKRAAVLRLWLATLVNFLPRVEPEASHFVDLMDWLDTVVEALEA